MMDYLRHVLFHLLVVAVVAAVWITAWAQRSIEEADRAWWPAKDPALALRVFGQALSARPPADPRHPANFGEVASLQELMGCDERNRGKGPTPSPTTDAVPAEAGGGDGVSP